MVSSYGSGIMGSSNVYDTAQENAHQKVNNEFGSRPFNCADLDKNLKLISDRILIQRKLYALPNTEQQAYINALELTKTAWESSFATHNCRDIIEKIRLQSMAVVDTSSAIKQEASVLDKSKNDQSLYIGLGGVVMLIGLYIILNK